MEDLVVPFFLRCPFSLVPFSPFSFWVWDLEFPIWDLGLWGTLSGVHTGSVVTEWMAGAYDLPPIPNLSAQNIKF